jgi:hypothetical protein
MKLKYDMTYRKTANNSEEKMCLKSGAMGNHGSNTGKK